MRVLLSAPNQPSDKQPNKKAPRISHVIIGTPLIASENDDRRPPHLRGGVRLLCLVQAGGNPLEPTMVMLAKAPVPSAQTSTV